VADPYYGDAAAFEAAWQVINRGVEAWVEKLLREDAQQNA
jgi:protein-tyrosine phosphatase